MICCIATLISSGLSEEGPSSGVGMRQTNVRRMIQRFKHYGLEKDACRAGVAMTCMDIYWFGHCVTSTDYA